MMLLVLNVPASNNLASRILPCKQIEVFKPAISVSLVSVVYASVTSYGCSYLYATEEDLKGVTIPAPIKCVLPRFMASISADTYIMPVPTQIVGIRRHRRSLNLRFTNSTYKR